MIEAVSASAEEPAYFEGTNGPILGIVTSAPEAVGNVVVFSGGWHSGSANANRMIVRLARRLAARFHNVVRFDWYGAGESPGHISFFRLDEPGVRDGLAAVDFARREAKLPTALVGVCMGTRAALAAAPQIPSLQAVALVSFPLPAGRAKVKRAQRISVLDAVRQGLRRDALRGWLQPATRRVYLKYVQLKWRSIVKKLRARRPQEEDLGDDRRDRAQAQILDDLLGQLTSLFQRGIRLLLLFGKEDATYEHFAAACDGPLGDLLAQYSSLVDVVTVEGDLSGFSSLDAQQTLIDNVSEWIVGPGSDA